ncbi:unnamed protein product [Clonostachys rosea]|uniref:Uncharacterized protein n=1 Tax=Bionectria ochroleuca TaxID=29856 RepID=A0ABY6V1U5_BIOOC|nr:unnamed protein product [Clonostachys rosea]
MEEGGFALLRRMAQCEGSELPQDRHASKNGGSCHRPTPPALLLRRLKSSKSDLLHLLVQPVHQEVALFDPFWFRRKVFNSVEVYDVAKFLLHLLFVHCSIVSLQLGMFCWFSVEFILMGILVELGDLLVVDSRWLLGYKTFMPGRWLLAVLDVAETIESV